MTNKNKQNKKALQSANPWMNKASALEMLRKQYRLPEPHLLRCWAVYMDDKKKSEKERRDFHKMLDDKPINPKLSDFDNVDEIKGAIVYNGEIEVEVELLATVKKDDEWVELVSKVQLIEE